MAAKAAGMDLAEVFYLEREGLVWVDGEGQDRRERRWNPLTDDGDALRLAVCLNFDILQDPVSSRSNFVEVMANLDNAEPQPWACEVRAPDPYAATRRAITRAAAAIGKAMT